MKPHAIVGVPQYEQGGLQTYVKKAFLNHLKVPSQAHGRDWSGNERLTLEVLLSHSPGIPSPAFYSERYSQLAP